MKKVLIAIVLGIAMLFCLTGCGSSTVTGTVTDLDVEYIFVESEDGTTFEIRDFLQFLSEGDGLTVGDTVEIEYHGGIRETDPATFEQVHDLRVIKEDAD